MPENLPSINLAKSKQTPLFDRFINWALTVGRLIVIITEVVAVGTFVYRFSLDEKLVDLNDAIKQKQNIVSVLKNDENKYRNLQDRIALASTFSEKGSKTTAIIANTVNLIPEGVRINDLTLNEDRVNISVNIGSVSSLKDLIELLKKNPKIKSISIDNIENRASIGLSVDITAMLK